ncbi:hypothetical protein, partial [Mesorhizobium sp. M4B.F.Ca.ET.150.01.1.1]
ITDIVTPRTLCIHLFDNLLRDRIGGRPIPAGSPLSQLLEHRNLPAAEGDRSCPGEAPCVPSA